MLRSQDKDVTTMHLVSIFDPGFLLCVTSFPGVTAYTSTTASPTPHTVSQLIGTSQLYAPPSAGNIQKFTRISSITTNTARTATSTCIQCTSTVHGPASIQRGLTSILTLLHNIHISYFIVHFGVPEAGVEPLHVQLPAFCSRILPFRLLLS